MFTLGQAAQATLVVHLWFDYQWSDRFTSAGMQNTGNIFLALQLPKSENNCDTTIFFNNITLLSEDS